MEVNIVNGPDIPTEILNNFETSLYELIINYASKHLDSVCMINAQSGKEFTIASIISRSEILTAELQSLGCRSGHVIGIFCENRYEYLVILLSIFSIEAIAACFNPLYSINELEHTLNITKPFIIFTNSYAAKQLNKIDERYKSFKYVINLDDSLTSHLSYKSFIKHSGKQEYVTTYTNKDDTAVILFSSGSTGLPKGVMLSKKNLTFILKCMRMVHETYTKNEPRVYLSVMPFFHGYGLLYMLRNFITGEKNVFFSKFNENSFLASIERYKVTNLTLVPPLMIFLAKNPLVNNFDLSSVREITCGAAPLSPDIEQIVKNKLKISKILKGYGMTETTVVITTNMLSSDKPGSVGSLLFGMKGKVIDLSTGKALGPYEEGELCFKGELIMKGYYNNNEETQKAIDEDGWLHTGDVGYYDKDGDFFIVDRIKDLIKYKGFQVAPAELEGLLLKHKSVKDVAVVGIADELSGEVPKAFVVKQDDVNEQELIDYISRNVSPHMKLRGGVTFIQEIPRNSNGKILRKELRNWSQSKL